MINRLPLAFSALEDLVDGWVLPTEKARMHKRYESPYEELQNFYDRAVPELPRILEYLKNIKPKDLSDPDRCLLGLTLMLAEVSIAVEKVKGVRSDSTYPGERLDFVHERSR